jgi:periplasmic divalent cation tolerance protein
MIIVFSTAPDMEWADKIAGKLVREGLAACVNVVKVGKSVYEWKGKVKEDGEYLLIIKAGKGNWEGIERAISGMHPYSIPEIVRIDAADAAEKYLGWVCGKGPGA